MVIDYTHQVNKVFKIFPRQALKDVIYGEHITDTYMTETDTTEPENLSHNIIDIFIVET